MAFFNNMLRIISRKPKSLEQNLELNEIETFFVKGDLSGATEKINFYKQNQPSYLDNQELEFFNGYLDLLEARVKTEQGKVEEGLNLAKNISSNEDDTAHPVLQNLAEIELANSNYQAGNLNEAVEKLNSSQNEVGNLKLYYPKNYLKNYSRLTNLRGKVEFRKGNFDEASKFIKEALESFEKLGNNIAIAEPLNDMGNIQVRKGNYDRARKYFNDALEIYEELDNQRQILKIFNNIGLSYWQETKLDQALDNFSKSLDISQSLGIKNYSGSIMSNMGTIYLDMGRVDDAKSMLEKAEAIFEELGNKQFLSTVYLNLGNIHNYIGDVNTSLDYYNKAKEIFEEFDVKAEIAGVYSSLANLHAKQRDYEEAFKRINQSIEIFENIGLWNDQLHPLYNAIEYSLYQDKKDQAEEYLQKLENVDSEVNSKLSEQLFKLSKAKILNKSDRVVNKAEAQKLFQEIADDQVVSEVYTTDAMLELGELLLQELNMSPSEEALNEFKELINQLDRVTKAQGSTSIENIPTMVQVLLLRSKLALIDLNVEEAQKLLDKAYELAKDKGLKSLASDIDEERERHKNNLLKYKQMVENNASLYERLQQTQIENYLKRAEGILKR